jgi:putative polyketide hydroxylase
MLSQGLTFREGNLIIRVPESIPGVTMSLPADEHAPVLIVGAGPAGLSAAIELADQGITPLVLERRPDASSHPRATALTAATMQLISRWGVADPVRRSGFHTQPAMSVRVCATGPEIQRIPMDAHVWTCAQDDLETILAARALAAGAQLRYGAELADLRRTPDGAVATVAAAGQLHQIAARHVIGADGAGSTVRRAAGIRVSRTRDFGAHISILFRAPLRDHLDVPPFMVYGIDNPAGGVLVPAGHGDRWICGLPWHPELGERSGDYDYQRSTNLVRSAAGIPDLPVTIIEVRVFNMAAAIADQYRSGPILLAGDAAHVFTPVSGMGLNLALHDGVAAARYLADAIINDHVQLLDQYEATCRPLAEELLEPELTIQSSLAPAAMAATPLRPLNAEN